MSVTEGCKERRAQPFDGTQAAFDAAAGTLRPSSSWLPEAMSDVDSRRNRTLHRCAAAAALRNLPTRLSFGPGRRPLLPIPLAPRGKRFQA